MIRRCLVTIATSMCCIVGCGQYTLPRQVGVDINQITSPSEPNGANAESGDDTTIVADMECPPVETAASNFRGGSSCSHASVPPVAVAARDSSGPSGIERDRTIAVSESPAAKPAMEAPMQPNRASEDDSEDDAMTGGNKPKKRMAILNPIAPNKMGANSNMTTTCEPRWLEWNGMLYDCCIDASELPVEVSPQCSESVRAIVPSGMPLGPQ